MTPRPPLPPTQSRTGGRRSPVVLRDECCDHDEPGRFDRDDDAGQLPHTGRSAPNGRATQVGGDFVPDGWDDLGPEAA